MPTLYWCPHQVLKATGAPVDYQINLKNCTIEYLFVDMYNKEVDDLIHQMVYGCNLPESSRREVNERLNSNPTNKLDPKIAAKIAARDKIARKSKNKCMYTLFFHFFT